MSSRNSCPVCRTAEIVCGKWTLLVIRDLAEGRSRFCELERSLQGISPRTLSLRLRALEEEGIVERQTYPEVPPRVEYALTEKGRALVPLIESMRVYGSEWLGGECEAAVTAAVASAAAADSAAADSAAADAATAGAERDPAAPVRREPAVVAA
jgi:DNA-binding HxlR family transcriptional regulator